jgi:outer membrane protein assembly factor BamB
MLKKIETYWHFIFFTIWCILVILIAIWSIPDWEEALTTHTLVQKDNSHLELLWVQTVFISNADYGGRRLAATDGMVFVIGTLSQRRVIGLVALDSENGKEFWHVFDSDIVEIGPEIVYTDSEGSVVAYNLTGKKLWQTKHWGKFIDSMDEVNGKLYVQSGYEYFLMDAVTGDVLATSSRVYSSKSNYDPDLRWFFGVTPVFVNGLVFTREGDPLLGAAIAYNKESGNILWRSADNVISNVAATEHMAFFITHDDELRILHARTGKLLETIRIEPSIGYFELAPETNVQHEGYFLAVDQTHQLLYMLLGDSNQLFAFRIRP